jgi:phenylacetic acid degradation operon negative regulatory protein
MLSIEKQILFLMTRKRELSVKDLVPIYTKRGYKEQSIRNVLSRLKKEEYIVAASRSVYSIVEKGRDFLASVNRKPWQYDMEWRRTWYFVQFEIPESHRAKRDQVRTHLLQLGFGQLYKGVYISPWDHRKQLASLIHANGVEKHVTISEASILFNDITKEHAAEIWNLDVVHRLYEEKLCWYQEYFVPALNKEMQEGSDPLELFVLFLHIGEIISEISLMDPMLPLMLLPVDWIGHRVFQELSRSFQSFTSLIPRESVYFDFLVTL